MKLKAFLWLFVSFSYNFVLSQGDFQASQDGRGLSDKVSGKNVIPTLSGNSNKSHELVSRVGKNMFSGLTGILGPSGTSGQQNRCTSNGEEGVCYSRSQCTNYGGTSGESCSRGGICCILKSMCLSNNTGMDVTIKRNLTHLVEPPNYNPPQQCRFNIPKQRGVCQLRLDFKRFDLAPADTSGNCNADIMVITGSDNIKTLKLCGDAQKQHLYLHYGSSDVISVSLNLLNTNSSLFGKASYDILVTMIKCNSVEKAPEGCTQYFSQTSDEVRSFNFNKRMQLNEQMYMVCVKSFTGSSKIKWEKCSVADPFILTGTSGSGSISHSGNDCNTDYVEILGTNGGKYCGSDFPPAVSSEAKPYMMWVNFDDEEIPIPNTPWNPDLGCYESWKCYNEMDMEVLPVVNNMPNPNLPCNKVDTQYCKPPPWINVLTDFGNSGFCLRYTVS